MVCSTGSQKRGNFVRVSEAGLGSIVEELDLDVESAKMLVHSQLHLLGQGDLVLGEQVGFGVAVADLGAECVLLGVRLVAAVGFDPFLNLAISIFDEADAFIVLAIFVGDLVLNEANLLGQILNAVDPVVEDDARIEGLV